MTMLLRIHQGIHNGAEIALADGEYNLGASEECDIILADSGVRDHHLRIRVAGGQVFVLVYEGANASVDGAEIEADEVEVPAFAVVRAGGCAFRMGPDNVEWPELVRPEPELPETEEQGGESAPETALAQAPKKTGAIQGKAARLAGKLSAVPALRPVLNATGKKRWIYIGVAAFVLLLLLYWLVTPSAGEMRLRNTVELLEARGYSVTRDPAMASGTTLLVEPGEDRKVVVSGAVDFARQTTQIESVLTEAGIASERRLVAREQSLRNAEAWLRQNDVPLEVKMVGKTRASVQGYAEGSEGDTAFNTVRALLAGFDNVNPEITNWTAMNAVLSDILSRRGLGFLEVEPATFHITITGLLETPAARQAWEEAELEIKNKLRFSPRFVWMRPASEYLRLARGILEQWSIPLEVVLGGRKALGVSGFVRDEETAERVLAVLRPLINEWPGGSLAGDFTTWGEAEGVLKESMAKNNVKDAEVTEVGEFGVFILGDISVERTADAWRMVSLDMERSLRHPPPVVWRAPPPPEEGWLDDLAKQLDEQSIVYAEIDDPAQAIPTTLSIARGEGLVRMLGSVDTLAEKRALQNIADSKSYRVEVEVISREELLARAERLAADKGVTVAFNRVGPTRLEVSGYAKDVESTERIFNELKAVLTGFTSVEESFVNWPMVSQALQTALKQHGLDRLRYEPLDYAIEVQGELSPAEAGAWNQVVAAVSEAAGIQAPLQLKAPPSPADATVKDVFARLVEMGLDPVLGDAKASAPPFALAVSPAEGGMIRITGLVETVEQKRGLRILNDEGMKHVVIEVDAREEMLKQAERYLTEMNINLQVERLSIGSLLFKGYVFDMATGELLLAELQKILGKGFADIDEDFTYWSALRQPLADLLASGGLERIIVYPGEFELITVGTLETDEEKGLWTKAVSLVDSLAETEVTFSWHESMPPLRPSRFASVRDASAPPIAGGKSAYEEALASAAINLTGTAIVPGAPTVSPEDAVDWHMRLAAVETKPEKRMRTAGSDKWYREGEMIQGHLVMEIFPNGALLLRENNIVIYTVDSDNQEAENKGGNSGKVGDVDLSALVHF